LEKLEPKPSRDIEVTRFVSPEEIGSQWYDRPYYLGPDGDEKAYFAFVEALENQKKQGIARWVMRGKEYSGALRPLDGYLTLVTLRHAGEVITAEELPEPAGRSLDKKELAMAKQLVELLEGDFDPAEFSDEYRERLMDFIGKKAKGRKPRLHAVQGKRPSPSLEKTLAKSIANLKKQREKRAA
jgi:DNA end-binding protein Ku